MTISILAVLRSGDHLFGDFAAIQLWMNQVGEEISKLNSNIYIFIDQQYY